MLLLGRELACVAALGLLADDAEVEERRAERAHLLGDRRTDVEARDDGAQAARRRDRLEAGDARAEHERARRRDRARGGRQHRQEPRQMLGADENALVARHRRLRRERVHRLRTGRARDRFHREAEHAQVAELLDPRRVGEGLEKRDQELPGTKLLQLRVARRCDLGDPLDVLPGIGDDLGAGLGVLLVGDAPPRPRRPFSTMMSKPSSFATVSGTSATRCSPLAFSLGTPTLICARDPSANTRPGAGASGRPLHSSRMAVSHQLETYGLILLFAFVAVESAGIPVPGETALITAGVLAAGGRFNIVEVIAVAAIAAIIGDSTGYWIARTGGRKAIGEDPDRPRRSSEAAYPAESDSSSATGRRPS